MSGRLTDSNSGQSYAGKNKVTEDVATSDVPKDRQNKTGRVIVITSGKGGVGKTTATANIGTGLARAGHRVCMVDADVGLRNLDVIIGLENRIVYDLVEVIEGTCKLRSALIRDKRMDNLFLLPAAQTRDKDAIAPEQFKELCLELAQDFDFVIVASPAGIEQGFRNAIAGADEAIVVTTPEVSAVRDADRITGMLEANELYAPKLIINRVRPEMVRRGDMMDIKDVIEILAIELLGVIPDDPSIIVAANKGEPVILDSKSRAAIAYDNIVRRILGEDVPPMNLQQEGLLERLRRLMPSRKAN